MNLLDVERELTALKSWATKQGFGNSLQAGRYGDFRVVWGEDNLPYIEASTNKGVVTSFQSCFSVKGVGRPELHLKNLTVDNLFAKTFNVKQITGTNGDLLVSDSAIVESAIGNTITFSDPSNLNLCPFVINDKCIVKRIKYDKSLDIKESTFTVTAVSGRTVTVTWDTGSVIKGDIVVRSGNSSNTARQNMIYLSINDTNSPYIDCLTGLTSATAYRTATPKVRLGNLAGITDADFGGALTGYGLYAQDVYLKGKIKISSNADIIGLTIPTATYSSGDTFPVSPVEGDWHFYTGATGGGYTKNCWYRYSGSAWGQYGLTGTYIDGTGVYTGTVVASQVIAGTLTGFTIQTSATGQRVVIDSSNTISFYKAGGTSVGSIYGGTYGLESSDIWMVGGAGYTRYMSSGISILHFDLPNPEYVTFAVDTDGIISEGIWQGTAITDTYISSASTWNAKESALTFSSPLSRTTNTISIPVATSSANGYLSSTDWSTFNGKANAFTGATESISFDDNDAQTHSVTIVNGIITAWTVS